MFCLKARLSAVAAIAFASAIANAAPPQPSEDNPARQPYHCKVAIDLEAFGTGHIPCPDVPTGKRLVVEFISAMGITKPGGQAYVVLVPPFFSTATEEEINVPLSFGMNSGTSDLLFANQRIRLYVNAGPGPRVQIFQNSATPPASLYRITIVGHLVDLP